MPNQTTKKYVSLSLGGRDGARSYRTNTPKQYADQQKQYMAGISRRFISQRAYLSSDFVSAQVQGISSNFYDYVQTNIRLADVSSPSASISKRSDDFKEILFADPKITYIPVGAKIKTMGSTWLVINPSNMASAQTTAVIVRCNTYYNSYNDYGALVTEPIYVEKESMLGNDDFTKQNLVLMDGYFNVICQLNENTKKLGHNQRIILGDMAYHITGFTDFIKEFTDEPFLPQDQILQSRVEVDEKSGMLTHYVPEGYQGTTLKINGRYQDHLVSTDPENETPARLILSENTLLASYGERNPTRLIRFTARLEETTNGDDVDQNYVANGNSEDYTAKIVGDAESITVGNTLQLSAALVLNGDEMIQTNENPIDWIWSVSDSSVMSIDANGLMTAIAEGTSTVTVALLQNDAITTSVDIRVTGTENEPYVQFTSFSDTSIIQYDSEIYTASFFENGVESSKPIEWSFSGASEIDYSAEIDGNTVMITCNSASDIPLTLTASCQGYSASINIVLEGY